MAVSPWPSTLPQRLLATDYNESPANLVLRTPMDAGPAKVRRRVTSGVRPVKGSVVLTPTQLGYFKTFYTTTLLGGSLRFSWVDPVDGVTAVEMRFAGDNPPSWVWEEGYYKVTMDLEILP